MKSTNYEADQAEASVTKLIIFMKKCLVMNVCMNECIMTIELISKSYINNNVYSHSVYSNEWVWLSAL